MDLTSETRELVEIADNLFIADLLSARSLPLLTHHNITHILSVGADISTDINPTNTTVTLKFVHLIDDEDSDLISLLPETFEFIDGALGGAGGAEKEGGSRVLVHCVAGVSRSASVIIAYLMKAHTLTLEAALERVRARYPKASPNPGFLTQLKLYEEINYIVDVSQT
ncbi:hypothetical protein HK102_011700, partial [Quaeritorhiza haematococci]